MPLLFSAYRTHLSTFFVQIDEKRKVVAKGLDNSGYVYILALSHRREWDNAGILDSANRSCEMGHHGSEREGAHQPRQGGRRKAKDH